MVDAICREIDMRSDYLQQKHLDSIYFGGGTPSLLDQKDMDTIFESLARHHNWNSKTEITLEANPDDLTPTKIRQLQSSAINRLSIGIQSFDNDDLLYMNRAHNASEAADCIKLAQDAGFDDISADLIYGVPTADDLTWITNIDKMLAQNIAHISAYALTVEEGTALHHFIAQGKTKPVDDDVSSRQYDILIAKMEAAGYTHYEISNFAKPGKYAIHNSNYWLGKPYLGLGPSAHSYDGKNRRSWNISHNAKYIKQIAEGNIPMETEELSPIDAYNEYILIRLRTIWGVDRNDIQTNWMQHLQLFDSKVTSFIRRGLITKTEDIYTLTKDGKHLGDKISMELFAE